VKPRLLDDYKGSSHAFFFFENYTSSEPRLSSYHAPIDPSTMLRDYAGKIVRGLFLL